MDWLLIILVIAIVAVALFFRDFKSVVYFLGILEIFFRIVHKLASLLKLDSFTSIVNKYIPNSLESIIDMYSSGILNTVLVWLLLLLFIAFEWYLIKYWVKKKK